MRAAFLPYRRGVIASYKNSVDAQAVRIESDDTFLSASHTVDYTKERGVDDAD